MSWWYSLHIRISNLTTSYSSLYLLIAHHNASLFTVLYLFAIAVAKWFILIVVYFNFNWWRWSFHTISIVHCTSTSTYPRSECTVLLFMSCYNCWAWSNRTKAKLSVTTNVITRLNFVEQNLSADWSTTSDPISVSPSMVCGFTFLIHWVWSMCLVLLKQSLSHCPSSHFDCCPLLSKVHSPY